jgi:hypothetical protein
MTFPCSFIRIMRVSRAWRAAKTLAGLFGLAGLISFQVRAATIDFEGLPDGTILTTQYPGVVFTNAIILTAGISLNEFEFPPHSGMSVASDSVGPITITFNPPVQSFSGFLTYRVALTLRAFDASNNQVATAASHFTTNVALSGVAGSSPNELLSAGPASGISRVTITGDPAGGSFTLDDASSGLVPTSPIPVLSPLAFVGLALLLASLGALATGNSRAVRRTVAVAAFLLLPLPFDAQLQIAPRDPVAPRIETVGLSRTHVSLNRPTLVTVVARITDARHIPASVNLIRFDRSGGPTIIGRLPERASGGFYTFRVPFNEATSGRIRLQISTAFHGRLRRVLSEPLFVTVAEEK